jgi:hypothetical protein
VSGDGTDLVVPVSIVDKSGNVLGDTGVASSARYPTLSAHNRAEITYPSISPAMPRSMLSRVLSGNTTRPSSSVRARA